MAGTTDTIHVLHVDDEPSLADMVGTFLERDDDRITVQTATSTDAAQEKLANYDVDCVISDYDMPGQNGLEFLEAVRGDHPDLPFILYTGKGSEEVASEAISKGVTDYLQKEGGTDQYTILANRVVNAVERYRAGREAEQTRTQLRAILENTTDAIIIIDADSRIQFANSAVEDHFGYIPSEIEGQRLTTLMPQRHREQHLAALDRYLETGERSVDWTNIEFPGLHRDGSEVPLSVSYGEFQQDGEHRFVGILRDISDRTRMEAELREREERFRQLAENIEEVVWMADPEKEELLYVNPAYEDIWGQSTDTLYDDPTTFLDAVHPEDRDRVESALDLQLSSEYDEEYRIIRPDGELRWVRDRAVPIENDAGDVYRMVGIASDITERKEQTRQLETLINNLPGMVYRCRNESNWPMVFVRGECEDLTGYSAAELERGDGIWGEEIIHPEDKHRAWAAVQESIENDRPFELTYRIQTKDGTTKWMWERGRVVNPEYTEETLLEGFITDITDRKEREQELRRIERRYQAVFDDPNILVGLLDPDGTVLDINQTAINYVDASPAEIAGEPFWDTPWFDHSEDIQQDVKERIDRAADGEYVEFEADLERPAGEPYTVEGVFRPVTNDEGTVVSLLISDRDITERKKNEQELEQTNALLSTLIEALPMGVLAEDASQNVLTVNERLFELFEMPGTPKEAIGADCEQLAEEVSDMFAESADFVERLNDIHDEPTPVDDETLALTDGRTFERAHRSIELPDGEGHLWVYRDVTDRKERERELREEQQFVKSIFQSLPDPLYAFDTDGYLIRWNEGFQDVVGHSGTELEGMHVTDFVPDGAVETISANLETILNEKEPVTVESVVETNDGTHIPYELTGGPLETADGTTRGVTGIGRDITERKAHERQLEALNRVAQELMSVEAQDEVVDIGIETVRDLLGIDANSIHLYDEGAEGLVPAAATDAVYDIVGEPPRFTGGDSIAWRVYQQGESLVVDDVHEDPDRYNPESPIRSELYLPLGEYGVLLAGSPSPGTFDDQDVLLGEILAGALTAALEQIERTDQLRARERALTAQNDRLDEFVSIVSHDLRNPLSVAEGRLELAADECNSEHLKHVEQAHERMRTLIEDLLSLARKGEAVTDVEPVALTPLVEGCWANVETGAATLTITIDRRVEADESRLKQLFENLMRNAIEHGDEDVTVTVGELDGGFYIEDDGPGIPVDERETIFEAGYSTSEGGTGFGLSIVEQIVEAHGWDIHATDGDEDGARFEITGVTFATE